jgi:hypothetical protein
MFLAFFLAHDNMYHFRYCVVLKFILLLLWHERYWWWLVQGVGLLCVHRYRWDFISEYEGKLANVDLGDILISYSFGMIFFRQLKELGGS